MPVLPPPTVRSLVERSELGLLVRAGSPRTDDGEDRPVRWVAVSELEDPRPFLEGGELLLSTGMRLTATNSRSLGAYVDRLVDARVAALGLGVGLTHDRVPVALLKAANRRGLVVLEVPEPTPFIAVTKAVSDLVAAQTYESTTRAFESQRELTRAALAPEALPALAARLARSLSSWCVVFDPAGTVLASAGPVGDVLLAALGEEIAELRSRGRSSASLDLGDDRVALHPLGAKGAARGYLAVGRPTAFDRSDASVVAIAVSLLSLALERGVGAGAAAQGVRDAALALLLSGAAPDSLPLDALGWAWMRDAGLRVLRFGAATRHLISHLEGPEMASGLIDDELVLVLSDHAVASIMAAAPAPRTQGFAGGSSLVSISDVSRGYAEAGRALQLARNAQRGEVVWHDTVGADGLLGLVSPESAASFSDALLAPLEVSGGKADLVASAHAWLSHNGQWDVAAGSLGVHRHTLRYRMRKVEELLGRPLDDPGLRADLWFALQVRHRAGSLE